MLLQTALRHFGAGWWLVALISLVMIMGADHARAEGDKVVATVNNEAITEGDFYNRLQKVKGADFLVQGNPPGMRQENAGYIILNSMINERLILQLAAKNNLTPIAAELDVDLVPLLKQENIIQAIANHLVTANELKYDITVQHARYNLATNRQTVTPAEVEAFYNDNIDIYKSPERWVLSAIRTTKIDDAAKVTTELKDGKSFEETARTYSEDERTRATGGKIGVFDATDKSLPEDIKRAVRDLKVGEITNPIGIQFDNGTTKRLVYWIVKLMDRQMASQRQLADVRHQVERLATLKKVGGLETGDKKIADFRKSSDVKINLPGYDALLNPPAK